MVLLRQIIKIQFLQSKVACLVFTCQNIVSIFLMRSTPQMECIIYFFKARNIFCDDLLRTEVGGGDNI